MKYRLRRESGMFRLWNALPFDQWVTVKELRRLTEKMNDGTRHSALSALIARNLVKRRPSRANLNAYDYLRLREDEAIDTPDGPPDGSTRPVAPPERQAREVGGDEPFAPPIAGGEGVPAIPLMVAPHGTARCYMTGCGDPRCERAYRDTQRALGLA